MQPLFAGFSAVLATAGLAAAQSPTATYTAANCNDYQPATVDWAAVRSDILAFLSRPDCSLPPEGIPCKRVAALMVRASAHDALPLPGGADGSLLLAPEELSYPGNHDIFPWVHHVRDALAPIVAARAISWADAIAVAGAVASEYTAGLAGSPRVIVRSLRTGRCDNPTPNSNTLAPPDLSFEGYVKLWADRNMTIDEGDALMGSHALMRDSANATDSSGPHMYHWDTKYFKDTHKGTIAVANASVQWSEGHWRYTVNDALLAQQNVRKLACGASNCPFARRHNKNFRRFARSSHAFDGAYSAAYGHMMDLGAHYSAHSHTVDMLALAAADRNTA